MPRVFDFHSGGCLDEQALVDHVIEQHLHRRLFLVRRDCTRRRPPSGDRAGKRVLHFTALDWVAVHDCHDVRRQRGSRCLGGDTCGHGRGRGFWFGVGTDGDCGGGDRNGKRDGLRAMEFHEKPRKLARLAARGEGF